MVEHLANSIDSYGFGVEVRFGLTQCATTVRCALGAARHSK